MLKFNLFNQQCKSGELAQLVLWGLLGITIHTALTLNLPGYLPRKDLTTILKLLPDSILYSELFSGALRIIVITASLFWAFNFLLPISALLSAISFFTLMSLLAERTPYTCHQWHVVSVGLMLFSFWHWNSYIEILNSKRIIRFGRLAACPLWIPQTLLIYCSAGYFYSGATKLYHSGWAWPSGLSLQLWTYSFSTHESLLRTWILSSRDWAGVFQWVVFLAELLTILVVFSIRARLLVGVTLLCFHVSNEILFHFGFYGNILIVAFAFLANPLPPPLELMSKEKAANI